MPAVQLLQNEELTQAIDTVQQLASSLENLHEQLAISRCDLEEEKNHLKAAMELVQADTTASGVEELVPRRTVSDGNHVILTLFWQFTKECFQMERVSEGAFIPE